MRQNLDSIFNSRVFSPTDIQTFLDCPWSWGYSFSPSLPSQSSREGSLWHRWLHQDFLGLEIPEQVKQRPEWDYYQECIQDFEQGWSEWAFHYKHTVGETDYLIRGRIDRIYHKNKTLYIYDWKQGGRPRDGQVNARQLQIYIWIIQNLKNYFPGFDTIEAQYIYLKEESVYQVEAAHDMEELLSKNLPKMQANPFQLPAKPRKMAEGNYFCTLCHYQKICPQGNITS